MFNFLKIIDMNISFGNKSSKFFIKSPVSDLRVVELSVDGSRCVKFQNDVSLLLRQEKLVEQIGLDAVRNWLSAIGNEKAGMDTSSISDADLLRFIKPRGIQSASEMRVWSNYLDDHSDELLAELKRNSYYKEYKKEQDAKAATAKARQEKFDKFLDSNSK